MRKLKALIKAQGVGGMRVSAVLFGLGEAMFTGLRALVKLDYKHKDGPLKDVSLQLLPGGASGPSESLC